MGNYHWVFKMFGVTLGLGLIFGAFELLPGTTAAQNRESFVVCSESEPSADCDDQELDDVDPADEFPPPDFYEWDPWGRDWE